MNDCAKLSIDTIFCSAIEIESLDERRAYLSRACGDDLEIRRQAERLIEAHFRGGSIFDSPVHIPSATIDQLPTELPGTVIDRYKLLEQVGEGGMGVVYVAEQTEPVRRRVALKIIKPGMDTKQVCRATTTFPAQRQLELPVVVAIGG